jgi:hypothetical protein
MNIDVCWKVRVSKALLQTRCMCRQVLRNAAINRASQMREEQLSSLQVRRLKSFREPAEHVLQPTSRVS